MKPPRILVFRRRMRNICAIERALILPFPFTLQLTTVSPWEMCSSNAHTTMIFLADAAKSCGLTNAPLDPLAMPKSGSPYGPSTIHSWRLVCNPSACRNVRSVATTTYARIHQCCWRDDCREDVRSKRQVAMATLPPPCLPRFIVLRRRRTLYVGRCTVV